MRGLLAVVFVALAVACSADAAPPKVALAAGRLQGNERLDATVRLQIASIGLDVGIDGEIELE